MSAMNKIRSPCFMQLKLDYRKTFQDVYQPMEYCVCEPGVHMEGWLYLTHSVTQLTCSLLLDCQKDLTILQFIYRSSLAAVMTIRLVATKGLHIIAWKLSATLSDPYTFVHICCWSRARTWLFSIKGTHFQRSQTCICKLGILSCRPHVRKCLRSS